MNLPNYLSLLRIFLVPVFVLIFYLPFNWSRIAAAVIFALAAFTDWLDGYLARSWEQTSSLGEFLDPVADKLLVVVALVLLLADPNLPYLAIPAAVIIGREIVMSGLREWMSEIGKRTSVAVSYVAKVKTTIQMLALTVLIATHRDSSMAFTLFGYILFYLAAGLTLWTMFVYLRVAWPEFVTHKTD